jgi:shikimate kinase
MKRNVVLIGYRGTGKSSVAERVAEATNRTALHMDEVIVERAGRSIPQIVAEEGWEVFFDLESAMAAEAGAMESTVIDAGGGVIRREANMRHLARHGEVFWLTAQPETIRARLEGDENRPSLTGTKSFIEEIEEVLAERTPVYRRHADHIVATDNRAISDVADEVIRILRSEVDELENGASEDV